MTAYSNINISHCTCSGLHSVTMVGESIFNKNVEKHLDKLFGSLLVRRNPEPEPKRLTPYVSWPVV